MSQVEVLELHCASYHQTHDFQVSVFPELSLALLAQVREEFVDFSRDLVDLQKIVERVLMLVELKWQFSGEKQSERKARHAAVSAFELDWLLVLVE